MTGAGVSIGGAVWVPGGYWVLWVSSKVSLSSSPGVPLPPTRGANPPAVEANIY